MDMTSTDILSPGGARLSDGLVDRAEPRGQGFGILRVKGDGDFDGFAKVWPTQSCTAAIAAEVERLI